MTEFRGSQADELRIMQLEKDREKALREFEAKKSAIERENSQSVLVAIKDKFAHKSSKAEEDFHKETTGLVTAEQYRRKRLLADQYQEDAERARRAQQEEEERRRAKRSRTETSKLSFSVDEENTDEVEPGEETTSEAVTTTTSSTSTSTPAPAPTPAPTSTSTSSASSTTTTSPTPAAPIIKIKKNPHIDTSFLPDRERELRATELREKLAKEWLAEQEKIKKEVIEITFSFWDGSGHRRTSKVPKGTTIEQFLETVKHDFKEIRNISVDNLMFVKEDLIIPHHYSFYDLIESRARGKSGPLFHFDVHDDVRLVSDAAHEKDESHAAKVLERRWYDHNKHIFPASRWEVFDPNIQRDKYTIRDTLSSH
ncbi:Protein FAM50 [Pelomyxa schiedti]|nr:Protein FAM50 [Pelomyxa schiedti]